MFCVILYDNYMVQLSGKNFNFWQSYSNFRLFSRAVALRVGGISTFFNSVKTFREGVQIFFSLFLHTYLYLIAGMRVKLKVLFTQAKNEKNR